MPQNIALAMIVKNEEAVIKRCLDSVLPYVDRVVVNDNGSTDRTPEILTELQVETLHSPWFDFSTNRNAVLQLARDGADYVLCGLDADEVLVTPQSWAWPTLDKDAYWIECRYGHLRYKRMALVRADKPFEWRGVIHEALYCDEPYTEGMLSGVHILVRSDGARARSPDTARQDLALLETAVQADPNNTRYQFYLAQTLKDLGRMDEARTEYNRRVDMGGWEEEAAYAKYMSGKMTVLLQDSSPDEALLAAYDMNPVRAEPLLELARYHRLRRNFSRALIYAEAAAQLSAPLDGLFIEQDVYEWRALEEVVISAWYVPNQEHRGARAAAILSLRTIPPLEAERVKKNCEFYTRI